MGMKLTMTRRGFAKLAAVTGVAAAASTTTSFQALAEDEAASTRGGEIKRVRTC